ncbi:hypothetical protein [Azospirillum cavernae]|nr:hypothetical protein [Azospirillum cavernae]
MACIRTVSGSAFFAPRALGLAAVMMVLSVGVFATSAFAEPNEDRESPRVAAAVGPVGIVVIAANNNIYAFLDRLSDNAPVPGGSVRIKTSKAELILKETAPGVYRAGPFEPVVGHTALTVSVNTTLANGQMVADLVVAPSAPPQTVERRLRPMWYSLGLAAFAGLGFLAWRSRRRHLPPLAGAGTA